MHHIFISFTSLSLFGTHWGWYTVRVNFVCPLNSPVEGVVYSNFVNPYQKFSVIAMFHCSVILDGANTLIMDISVLRD